MPLPRLSARGFLSAALIVLGLRIIWLTAAFYAGSARRHHLEAAWFLFAAAGILAAIERRRALLHGGDDSTPPRRPVSGARAVILCIAMSVMLYAPALDIGLLSDDYVLLNLEVFDRSWEFFRPLPLLISQSVFALGGAAGLHLTNIVIHGCNAWLVSRVADRLARSGTFQLHPMIAAVLFLVFPGTVEAVAWNSGIFDLLLVCVSLAYVLAVMDRRRVAIVWGALLLAAAMFTKETAVIVPALALLLARPRSWNRPLIAISAGMTVVFVFARAQMLLAAAEMDLTNRYFLKELIVRPFASLVVPWTAAETARLPLLLAVLPISVLVVGLIGFVQRGGVTVRSLMLVLWVVASSAVLLNYLYIGPWLEGARYLYLPLVGWAIFVAELIATVPRWIPAGGAYVRAGIALAMSIAGVSGTWAHLGAWRNAAEVRDRILASAAGVVAERQCDTYEFAGATDSVEGAYVFRNGFGEAMQMTGTPYRSAADAECRFMWNGTAFTREQTQVP